MKEIQVAATLKQTDLTTSPGTGSNRHQEQVCSQFLVFFPLKGKGAQGYLPGQISKCGTEANIFGPGSYICYFSSTFLFSLMSCLARWVNLHKSHPDSTIWICSVSSVKRSRGNDELRDRHFTTTHRNLSLSKTVLNFPVPNLHYLNNSSNKAM
jgi:hypothetical protein